MTPASDAPKALTKNPLGATGETVAANVERLRTEQNLTFAALSERLSRIGRPIPTLGLRKIVAETRRVDADDLAALAAALDVSPITLLMPMTADADEEVSVTGKNGQVPAQQVWDWLRAWETIDRKGRLEWFIRSWPVWDRDRLAEKLDAFKLRRDEQLHRRRVARGEVPGGND